MDHVALFLKAEDDKLDLKDGAYCEVKLTHTRVKYKKDVCFALGVTWGKEQGAMYSVKLHQQNSCA